MDTDRCRRLTEERAAQGFPPFVEDEEVLRRVAAIVLATSAASGDQSVTRGDGA